MKETATRYVTMINFRSVLSLMVVGALMVLTGCDQSEQNLQPDYGDRYMISLGTSVVGDASGVNIRSSTAEVTAPDTVSYFVQGYTTEKEYTWTLNGSELPVEARSQQSYEWERRGGEFVTLVFTQGDSQTNVDPNSATTNTLRVNSPDDDINAEEIEITTSVPTIADQIGRLGNYSTASAFASSSGIGEILGGDGPYTLLAPSDAVLDALPAEPTQATDDDEDPTTSVRADILKYHAIAKDIASGDISDGQTETTLLGDQEVTFSTANGVSVNNGEADVVRADLPSSNGALHAIDAPLRPPTASVDFTDRTSDSTLVAEDTVLVDGSFIPDGGGFIVLHDSTELADLGPVASTIGRSGYIGPDSIANEVKVPLNEGIADTTTVGAMPHEDTNDNESYDFTGGSVDGPYMLNGAAIIDYGVFNIDVEDE